MSAPADPLFPEGDDTPPALYWLYVDHERGLPKWLRSGLHLVEVARAGKKFVSLRRPGALRGHRYPRRQFDAMAPVARTPNQTYGMVMEMMKAARGSQPNRKDTSDASCRV